MTSPRTTAQRLGPDAMEALVGAAIQAAQGQFGNTLFPGAIIAAARKLAEPEPVKPVWPTGKLWAWFDAGTGEFNDAEERAVIEGNTAYFGVPCRVVPADSVVLTREEAEDVRMSLTTWANPPCGDRDRIQRIRAARVEVEA